MNIICTPIAFGRWRAIITVDGVEYVNVIGPRPGCAIRDAINKFCVDNGMPSTKVALTIDTWE